MTHTGAQVQVLVHGSQDKQDHSSGAFHTACACTSTGKSYFDEFPVRWFCHWMVVLSDTSRHGKLAVFLSCLLLLLF